jgi:ABC-type amino acid transport system permease subunit
LSICINSLYLDGNYVNNLVNEVIELLKQSVLYFIGKHLILYVNDAGEILDMTRNNFCDYFAISFIFKICNFDMFILLQKIEVGVTGECYIQSLLSFIPTKLAKIVC